MVASLGNLPGQLAQLFLWSMDNFDKEMSDRYLLVRTSYNCFFSSYVSGGASDASCNGGKEQSARRNHCQPPCWQHGQLAQVAGTRAIFCEKVPHCLQVKQYTRSMERRGRGLTSSLEHSLKDLNRFKDKPSVDKIRYKEVTQPLEAIIGTR